MTIEGTEADEIFLRLSLNEAEELLRRAFLAPSEFATRRLVTLALPAGDLARAIEETMRLTSLAEELEMNREAARAKA